jgi:ankyrin repeat protein
VVKLLLDRNVDIKSNDENWWTPLLSAAEGGHEAVVKLLLTGMPISSLRTNLAGRCSHT